MPQSTSSEQFVAIDTIKDDCVLLKDGSIRAVIMVSGINFDLKSEEEQNLIIAAYQGLLNRLDFSLQFVVHSRKVNLDSYLQSLKEKEDEEKNALLRNQIKEYVEFIKNILSVTNIMSKRFYVVVPYAAGLAPEQAIAKLSNILPFGKKSQTTAQESADDFESQKLQLKRRVDAVLSGLKPTGVRCARLQTEDLLELYYNLYNPEKTEKKSLKIISELSEEEI